MKQLIGHDIGAYTFDPVAGTVTITGVSIDQEQLLIISNTTTGTILYLFSDSALGGSVALGVVSLDADCSGMNAGDSLQIYCDIPLGVAQYPSGSGSNGTVTLTDADTAYAIPGGTAPAGNYVMVVYNGSDTDMYWGYATLTAGGMLLPSGGTLTLNVGADDTIFAYCASAGKALNYSYKLVI